MPATPQPARKPDEKAVPDTFFFDTVKGLLGDNPSVNEPHFRELVLELECADVLRARPLRDAYSRFKGNLDIKENQALSERCSMALAFVNLHPGEGKDEDGQRFEKAIGQFYDAVVPNLEKVNDPRLRGAFARLLNELNIACCLYYHEDSLLATRSEAEAAVVLRDAIRKLLDIGIGKGTPHSCSGARKTDPSCTDGQDIDEEDEDGLVRAEIHLRNEALKRVFTNFEKAKVDPDALIDFKERHVIQTIPDVMLATRHLVRHIQQVLFGPPRLRAALLPPAPSGPKARPVPLPQPKSESSPLKISTRAPAVTVENKPAAAKESAKKARIDDDKDDVLQLAISTLGIADALNLLESSKSLKSIDPLPEVVSAPKRKSTVGLTRAAAATRAQAKKSGSSDEEDELSEREAESKPAKVPQAEASALSKSPSRQPVKPLTPAKPAAGSAKNSAAKKKKKNSNNDDDDGGDEPQRIPFSDAEVKALVKGVEKHGAGKWAEILHDKEFKNVFQSVKPRTSVNLKDKYRFLLTKGLI